MTPSPTPARPARQSRRPRSAQPAPPANTAAEAPSHGFQVQVSECFETRTVTTTTCLTRKFPPFFVHDPTPLQSLDSKEYPLATKPTPRELLEFPYVPKDAVDVRHGHESGSVKPTNRSARVTMTPVALKLEPVARQTHDRPSRCPRVHTRRVRASVAGSPTPSNTTMSQPLTSLPRPWREPCHSIVTPDKLRRPIAPEGSTAIRSEDGVGLGPTGPQPARGADSASLGKSREAELAFLSAYHSAQALQLSAQHSKRPDSPRNSSTDSAQSSSQLSLCNAASPSGSDSFTVFSSNVATPPITDADAAPFGDADVDEALQQSVRGLHPRPAVGDVATQDASLPSPRLSPTLAASQPASTDQDDDVSAGVSTSLTDPASSWTAETQLKQEGLVEDRDEFKELEDAWLAKHLHAADAPSSPVTMNMQSMLEAFDAMRTEMKTFMMYQFLRRCPRPTLRVIADTVNPTLKCDFLLQLPPELAYSVLSHLDCRDLCRAAQVSKHWRNMVDRNETGWKELFDRDGFVLPPGELTKAVVQGWGWQDPVGVTEYEMNLSMQSRLTSSEFELTRNLRQSATTLPRLRSSKRKRGLNAYSASERSKRRAAAGQTREQHAGQQTEARQHKSEGPLSAANAAALAVPDPKMGLPSLRQLHLFKSLYRRHYMIRRNWTSDDVKPSHVAFAAHPRHVITCLQFDNDKIITGSDDTLIHIYDTKTGKLRKKLVGHEGGVWALQYEGNILVSGSTDRSVRVWDMERGLCQQVFYGHTSTVRCLQILMPTQTGRDAAGRPMMRPEKPLIITGSRDSQLRVWRLPEIGSRRYIQTHPPAQESDCPYFIRALMGHSHSVRAISAHGDTLVSGSYDCTVRVWRISTGDSLHILRGHTQKVYSVVLDHERNRCISGSMDSLVKIWDLGTGSCLHTLEGHSLLVGLLDLRDERLVSAAADSTLRIWEPETGRCRHTLMAHTGAITCFQHDGHKVISGSEKTVKMWDAHTGQCVRDLLTDLSGVWQVKFDGRRCVAAVQRDQLTYVEILDFGAIRDGQPPGELGKRVLLDGDGVEVVDDGAI
ncbi:hypothetical protein L249_3015 [Ophiocordyceps polyrhachis-furcata BCC 54312]|uniref:F-box domain-containing protein n=1 Tax=Ophiocordyceps polyrhachis-furcata BCC 54312 TaxID=1330021 RepID=A0A367LQM3_9HYPO|nr:hypothetical protein L249_3015 [Ophiocordyceps polyrhachis-furcata BCC 54312]